MIADRRRVAAVRAAVSGGGAVGVQPGHAPPGPWVAGSGGDQVAAVVGVGPARTRPRRRGSPDRPCRADQGMVMLISAARLGPLSRPDVRPFLVPSFSPAGPDPGSPGPLPPGPLPPGPLPPGPLPSVSSGPALPPGWLLVSPSSPGSAAVRLSRSCSRSRKARTRSSSSVPGTPAARRSRARCSTCCQDASASSGASSRAITPALPESSPELPDVRLPLAACCRFLLPPGPGPAPGGVRRTGACPRSWSRPSRPGPSSALAASAADRTRVSSSMIRRSTGCSFPAPSAAKQRGSRSATVQRVVHLPGGRLPGQVQLVGQLVGGELVPAALTRVAAGELPDRGHRQPRRPRFHPPPGADDADQLVFGQAREPGTALTADSVQDRGQQHPGRQVLVRPPMGELVRVELPGRQAQEQALLPRAAPSRSSFPSRSSGGMELPGSSPSSGLGNGSWRMSYRPS